MLSLNQALISAGPGSGAGMTIVLFRYLSFISVVSVSFRIELKGMFVWVVRLCECECDMRLL